MEAKTLFNQGTRLALDFTVNCHSLLHPLSHCAVKYSLYTKVTPELRTAECEGRGLLFSCNNVGCHGHWHDLYQTDGRMCASDFCEGHHCCTSEYANGSNLKNCFADQTGDASSKHCRSALFSPVFSARPVGWRPESSVGVN